MLKKVNNLSVKVTYEVDLKDLEIPEDVYNELVSAEIDSDSRKLNDTSKYPLAYGWLCKNVGELDSVDWGVEVIDVTSDE
jgi:hypothetical protein